MAIGSFSFERMGEKLGMRHTAEEILETKERGKEITDEQRERLNLLSSEFENPAAFKQYLETVRENTNALEEFSDTELLKQAGRELWGGTKIAILGLSEWFKGLDAKLSENVSDEGRFKRFVPPTKQQRALMDAVLTTETTRLAA